MQFSVMMEHPIKKLGTQRLVQTEAAQHKLVILDSIPMVHLHNKLVTPALIQMGHLHNELEIQYLNQMELVASKLATNYFATNVSTRKF